MTERERHKCLEVLGLTASASEDDIKKAYRSLAKQYHPDKNTAPGSKERFQEIGYAYKYLTEGPSVVEDDDDDIMVEVLIRMFPWMFTGGFPGAFHPFSSHFFEPRRSPPPSFHRYHHCHHFDPYDYAEDEYYDTDSEDEYFPDYTPRTGPVPTATNTKADKKREKKRKAKARKKAARMEKASQAKSADTPPPETKTSSAPKEETKQKERPQSKGNSENGVSSETKSSSNHVSSAPRASSSSVHTDSAQKASSVSRSCSPASGGSPRTEQRKSTPTVASEPKKTKKQLQAEQKKREKEMEAIAAEFKKKQKEDEEKAAQKKAAKEEREKSAAIKAKQEQERAAKEEQERAAREEQERAARKERERILKLEQAAREEQERAARKERERIAKLEQAAREEQERAARKEREQIAKLEQTAREEQERAARKERERIAKLEQAAREKRDTREEWAAKDLHFGKSENRFPREFELNTQETEFYQTDCRPKRLDNLSTNSQTNADVCYTEASHHKPKKKRKNKKKSDGIVDRNDGFESMIPKTEDEELDMLQEAILRSQMEAGDYNLQTETNGRNHTEAPRRYFDTLDDVSDDEDGSSVFATNMNHSRSERPGWHDFISVKTTQGQCFEPERTNIQRDFTENSQGYESSGLKTSNAYLRSNSSASSHIGQTNIGQGHKEKTSSGSSKDSWEFGGNAERRFTDHESDIQFGFGSDEVTLSGEVKDAKDGNPAKFQQNHEEKNYFDQQNDFLEDIAEPSLSWAEQMELEQPTFDKIKGQNLGQGQPSLFPNAHSVSGMNDMDDIDDVDMSCESSKLYTNSSLSAASIDLKIPNAFSNKDMLKSYYKRK